VVQIGPRRVSYQRRGSGDPLLLIHGMAGHHRLWGEDLLDALARSFDVITYDHRGIGESEDDGGYFSIADLADDAVGLLDALGIARTNLLGFSMGGMVAQEIAIRHGGRVLAQVLAATYAGGRGSSLEAPGPMLMLAGMRTGDLDATVRAGYEANLSPAYTAQEAHYEPFKAMSLSVSVPIPVVLRQAQAVFGHDASARLVGVIVPTLVVHGTADQMLDVRNATQIAELLPNASLHTIAEAGHLFYLERPDETVELLRGHFGA
jgi:pimeloyl-ACP methyl ester carboxylesterase